MAYKASKRKRNGVRPKEGNGEGSFRTYRKKNGEKVFCFTFSYTDLNGNKMRKTVTGTSDVDCYKKRDSFLAYELNNLPNELKNATLSNMITLKRLNLINFGNCNEAGDSRNQSTQKIFEKYPIESPIGLMKIRDIDKNAIIAFRNELPNRYSQSVIDKIYILLRGAFKVAKNKGVIENNILSDPELNTKPKSNIKTKIVDAFNQSEEAHFFDLIDSIKIRKGCNDYRIQLHISDATGMRMGEINALTLESIDINKKTISVTRTISRGKKYKPCLKNKPKTEKSNRTIPISCIAMPYIQQALDNYIPNEEHLLFYHHKTKSYITTQQVTDWTKKKLKNTDIKFDGVHKLRHTFATNCARNNMPISILAKILGHEDTKVTMKYYITIDNLDMEEALDNVINEMHKKKWW